MNIGIHVSTAGGMDRAVDRAFELGCTTFQIFVSNPRGWKPTALEDKSIDEFKSKYRQYKMINAVSHSIYLINLASPKEYLRDLSKESLLSNLQITSRLGLNGLVTHLGSHQGDGVDVGLKRIVEVINSIFLGYKGDSWLLLENTAGAGNLVGKNLSEIGQIINSVKDKRLGFCLDTAHAFEYGYEIQTKKGLENLVAEIDKTIGLEKLKVIHLNDSMTALATNKDRHEEFGEGFIGKEGMIRIINHPALRGLPFIMETPKLKSGEKGREFIKEIQSYQS